jgi:hypothetical protein
MAENNTTMLQQFLGSYVLLKIWMSKLDISYISYRLHNICALSHSPQSDPKSNVFGKAKLPYFSNEL